MQPDFAGYASKYGVKCSDGNTILQGAFKANDKKKIPLVWAHQWDDPSNVLGHVILHERPDGLYSEAFFNDSPRAKEVKELILHDDVESLSIRARVLKRIGSGVQLADSKEVSVVYNGANPGAFIDTVFAHTEDGFEEVVIYTGEKLIHSEPFSEETTKEEIKQEMPNPQDQANEETIQDVFDSMSEKQKNVLYFMIAEAVGDGEIQQGDNMPFNLFADDELVHEDLMLTEDQIKTLLDDAKRTGSLKESAIMHADYGVENLEVLFPDAKLVGDNPNLISRDQTWVPKLLDGVKKTPFSRIKTVNVDITEAEARAKGFIKANEKFEGFYVAGHRVTTPTTFYVKQKMDRDDIVDITTLDIVVWMKTQMRVLLLEELARQILIGDGRLITDPDRINPDNIRPIWTDNNLYAHHDIITDIAAQQIDHFIEHRNEYKGSGTPTLYTTNAVLSKWRTLKDTNGRYIYETDEAICRAIRVKEIVPVEVMEGATRIDGTRTLGLHSILFNPIDYTVGADKGGETTFFENFDIDFNQHKYLFEGRSSGALTKPKSAIVYEQIIE